MNIKKIYLIFFVITFFYISPSPFSFKENKIVSEGLKVKKNNFFTNDDNYKKDTYLNFDIQKLYSKERLEFIKNTIRLLSRKDRLLRVEDLDNVSKDRSSYVKINAFLLFEMSSIVEIINLSVHINKKVKKISNLKKIQKNNKKIEEINNMFNIFLEEKKGSYLELTSFMDCFYSSGNFCKSLRNENSCFLEMFNNLLDSHNNYTKKINKNLVLLDKNL